MRYEPTTIEAVIRSTVMDRARRGSTAASFEQHTVLFGVPSTDHQLLNISPPNSSVRRSTLPDIRRAQSPTAAPLLVTRHHHCATTRPPTPPPLFTPVPVCPSTRRRKHCRTLKNGVRRCLIVVVAAATDVAPRSLIHVVSITVLRCL